MMIRIVMMAVALQLPESTSINESRFGAAYQSGVVIDIPEFERAAYSFAITRLKQNEKSSCAVINIASSGEDLMLMSGPIGTERTPHDTFRDFEEISARPFPALRLVKIGPSAILESRDKSGQVRRQPVRGYSSVNPLIPFSTCEIVHMRFGRRHASTKRSVEDTFRITAFVKCARLSEDNGLKIKDYLAKNCGTKTVTVFLRPDAWFSSDDYPPFPPFQFGVDKPTIDRYSDGQNAVLLSDSQGIQWRGPRGGPGRNK